MVDYKTIVSTTDSKVTLMQWLQALAKEFDNAKITDIAFANDGNSSLTFTFAMTDGTTKTASCKAITLTDDEKVIVSGLVGQVATSADGITFNKAVTFAGNIVTKGNEIHNGYESHLGDESHAGSEIHKGQSTFTDLRADDITATDGQDLLSYDGTNTSLKGKGTRPLYNTSELALKSDIITYMPFTANDAFEFKGVSIPDCNAYVIFHDDLTEGTAFAQGATFKKMTIHSLNNIVDCAWMFATFRGELTIKAIGSKPMTNVSGMFYNSPIEVIPALDLSNITALPYFCQDCWKLTSMNATGMSVSFALTGCSSLSKDAVVSIFNNLASVTTSPTLTLPSGMSAKLSDAEKAIATNKGWNLA